MTHRIKIGLVMNSSCTVSAEAGLRLVTTPRTIVPLTGSLFYSRQDAYAVRIAFHAGEVTTSCAGPTRSSPDGQESGHIDIDIELNDLLRQAS